MQQATIKKKRQKKKKNQKNEKEKEKVDEEKKNEEAISTATRDQIPERKGQKVNAIIPFLNNGYIRKSSLTT